MPLANYITFLRIILILPIMYLTNIGTVQANFFSLALFLLAGFTDYLDGYIARKTNTESGLGALLDLVADKLLVCIVLVWLIIINSTPIYVVPVLLIIFRELTISSIRQYIVEKEGKNNIEVSLLGKSKTTVQFIAISFMIISPGLGHFFKILSLSLIWLSALISIVSLYTYLLSWRNKFK